VKATGDGGASARLGRLGMHLEVATITWNVVEAGMAVVSGVLAASVALTGFGVDSAIEVISAALVLIRLRAGLAGREPDETAERRTMRAVALCFLALAVYLVADGVAALVTNARPQISPVGIVITALALVVMPTLAVAKVRTGRPMGNPLLIADAGETRLCAALAAATLVSVALYAGLAWGWADPVAGFVIAAVALWEGRRPGRASWVVSEVLSLPCGPRHDVR